MVWYSHFFKSFPQFVMIHTVRVISIVDETEVDVFLEFPCFLYDPMDVASLSSDSSSFSKPNLYIWKFLIRVLLKPCLKDFEHYLASVQFSSVAQSTPWNCSMPGYPVHHQFSEPTQTHVHCIGDAIQPPHPLLSPSPPAFNLSQHQGLFQRVSSTHQVAKVLEFQLQHQSFQ